MRTFCHNHKEQIMKTPTEFSERMKMVRLEKNITQSQIAEGSSFDKSFISRLESGERKPTRDGIMYIAESMGLTADETDELLMSAHFMPIQPSSLLHEPKLVQINDLIGMLSDDNKEFARQELERLTTVLSKRMVQVAA